jgi:hypothetical protein
MNQFPCPPVKASVPKLHHWRINSKTFAWIFSCRNLIIGEGQQEYRGVPNESILLLQVFEILFIRNELANNEQQPGANCLQHLGAWCCRKSPVYY